MASAISTARADRIILRTTFPDDPGELWGWEGDLDTPLLAMTMPIWEDYCCRRGHATVTVTNPVKPVPWWEYARPFFDIEPGHEGHAVALPDGTPLDLAKTARQLGISGRVRVVMTAA